MSAVQPTGFTRRSFVYRKLVALHAQFGEINDAAVALSFKEAASESEQAKRLGLADLSPLPRTGFKGPGTVEWLADQSVDIPGKSNEAVEQTDGALAARLSPTEVLLLSDLGGKSDMTSRLQSDWHKADLPPVSARGFPMPRQDSHAWFAVTGEHGAAMFAKLCGVDLRPHKFANGCIAQTSVARLSAIIIRHDLGNLLAYYALSDSAAAEYFWDCLVDAVTEFDGAPVGLSVLTDMARA